VNKNEIFVYILGVILGLCSGFLDLKFSDLLLTALLLLAATMLLGVLSPQRPWRWTLTVAAFVPLAQFVAYVVMTENLTAHRSTNRFLVSCRRSPARMAVPSRAEY
jgi:bacteriorhodopsin